MILFLDYDGVLHPDPCLEERRLFEHAPRLAQALEPYPEVGIVLSTSWRTVKADAELLGPLPDGLRQRILGRTPNFSDCRNVGALAPYRRHAECMQWLRDHHMEHGDWWALDDRPDWFAPYCEKLLQCDSRTGFDTRMYGRLTSTLEVARQRAARTLDFELV